MPTFDNNVGKTNGFCQSKIIDYFLSLWKPFFSLIIRII